MKYHKSCTLVCLMFITTHLYAASFVYSGNCKFKGDMNDLVLCLDREMELWDKELNDIYDKIVKRTGDKKLKKSELLWIKFKDSDCAYMADAVNEGHFSHVIEKACLIDKTKNRINEFKRSLFISEWFEQP